MRLLPRTVQQLVTNNPDTQRVRDGLTAAVQPTLNFLNTFFQSAQDGSLQVTKPATLQSTLNVVGAATLNAVTAASIAATSFVSPTGFKSPIFGGTYGNASAVAATTYQLIAYGQVLNQNRLIQMPFAGSVVGMSCQYQGSTTQASISLQVNKNNNALWPLTNVTSGATGAYGYKNATKGTYSFAQGDFLTVVCQFGTAGSVQLQADIFVEMGA